MLSPVTPAVLCSQVSARVGLRTRLSPSAALTCATGRKERQLKLLMWPPMCSMSSGMSMTPMCLCQEMCFSNGM
jgi:hypothetical protein